jgi:hypothetical protein
MMISFKDINIESSSKSKNLIFLNFVFLDNLQNVLKLHIFFLNYSVSFEYFYFLKF